MCVPSVFSRRPRDDRRDRSRERHRFPSSRRDLERTSLLSIQVGIPHRPIHTLHGHRQADQTHRVRRLPHQGAVIARLPLATLSLLAYTVATHSLAYIRILTIIAQACNNRYSQERHKFKVRSPTSCSHISHQFNFNLNQSNPTPKHPIGKARCFFWSMERCRCISPPSHPHLRES